MKFCKGCGHTLGLDKFYKCSKAPSGYRVKCKSCVLKQSAIWRQENLERRREVDKAYRENNLEKIRKYQKVWYEENREEINKKQREYSKMYARLNPGKKAEQANRRRLRKMERTPNCLTQKQMDQIEEFYWLAKDLRAVTGEEYHVDHIIPLKGENISGLHVPWNLQILPADLNFRKGCSYSPSDAFA